MAPCTALSREDITAITSLYKAGCTIRVTSKHTMDVLVQREILRQISQLRHEFGFSVVFITHDLPLLLEISDRIAIMRDGELVELDTAQRIWTDPQDDYTKTLLSSFPRLTAERAVNR